MLVRQRPPEGLLAGFWELPGVEVPAGRPAVPEALAREVQAWLGTEVELGGRRLSYSHRFSHRLWRVEVWDLLLRGEERGVLPAESRLAWVEAGRLATLPVAAAHRPAMELAAQDQGDADQDQEQPFQGEKARLQAPPVAGEADPERKEAGAQASHGDQQP